MSFQSTIQYEEAQMKRNGRGARLMFVAGLLLVSACSMDWLTGSDGKGAGAFDDAGVCIRDLEALPGLFGPNRTSCSTDTDCPNGSYCDPATEFCTYECSANSDCGYGYECTCDGHCVTGDGPPDGTGTAACDRSEALLALEASSTRACAGNSDCGVGWRCAATGSCVPARFGCTTADDCSVVPARSLGCDTAVPAEGAPGTCEASPRSCTFNDDCPNGSRCEAGACVWDCLPGFAECGVGQTCDCYGRCADGEAAAEAAAHAGKQQLFVDVSPDSYLVEDGLWDRRIDVTVIATDLDVLEPNPAPAGDADPVGTLELDVHIVADEGVHVTCDVAGEPTNQGCHLSGTWTFYRSGELLRARRQIAVRGGADAAFPGPWSVRVQSTVAVASKSITFDTIAPPSPPTSYPVDGAYAGRVELLGYSQDGGVTAFAADADAQLVIPVGAWMNEDFVYFQDGLGILGDNGNVVIDTTNTIVGEPGTLLHAREGDIDRGSIGLRYVSVSSQHNEANGTFDGRFAVKFPFGNTYLHYRYRLVRSGDLTACSVTTPCEDGFHCGGSNFCVRGQADVPTAFDNLVNTDVDSGWSGASHDFRSRVVQNIAANPSLVFPDNIYAKTVGIARAAENGEAPISLIGARITELPYAAAVAQAFCERDFTAFVAALDGARPPGETEPLTASVDGATDGSICDALPIVAGGLLCIAANPSASPDLLDRVTSDSTFGYDASCELLHQALFPSNWSTIMSVYCVEQGTLRLSHLGVTETRDIMQCYLVQQVLDEYSNDSIFDEPDGWQEEYLCYSPEHADRSPLQTYRFDDHALSISGDLMCGDYAPQGIPLLYEADRRDGLEALDSGQMLKQCLAELHRSIPALPAAPAPTFEASRAYMAQMFRDSRCFSAPNFFSALPDGPVAGHERLFMRLLQQWLTLHGYLAQEGRQQYRLAKVLASADSLDTAADAAADTPDLVTLLDEMNRGWHVVFERADALMALPEDILRDPDYAPDADGREVDHEQTIGIAVMLLEVASQHLNLTQAYVEDAAADSYAQCALGAGGGLRASAMARMHSSLRYVATAEALAHALDLKARGTSGMPLAWDDRWQTALDELAAAKRSMLRAGKVLETCAHPLGVSEGVTPIFFGDVTGPSSQFFASSDYLVNQWALPFVETSRTSLAQARTAWLQRRASTVAEQALALDHERRLEELSANYGRPILDMCGIASMEASEVLDAMSDGEIVPEVCYLNTDDASCLAYFEESADAIMNGIYSGVDDKTVKWQLCRWRKVHDLAIANAEPAEGVCEGLVDSRGKPRESECEQQLAERYLRLLDAIEGEGDAYQRWRTGHRPLDKPLEFAWTTPTGDVVSVPLGKLYEVEQLAAHHAPDLLEEASADCSQELAVPSEGFSGFYGESFPLPDLDDITVETASRADCYRGELGAAALAIMASKNDVEVALAAWQQAQTEWNIQVDLCAKQYATNAKIQDLWDHHVQAMKRLQEMQKWVSIASSVVSVAASATTGGLTLNDALHGRDTASTNLPLGSLLQGGLGIGSIMIGSKVADEELAFRRTLAELELAKEENECFARTLLAFEPIKPAALRIEGALRRADIALVNFRNMQDKLQQLRAEGMAAVQRELTRLVPSLVHHYWLSEHVHRFETDFAWAKRLTYLALQAVEYEYQQSLPLRDLILSANHPDQLLDAIRIMQQEQLTRTINSRRPEEMTWVVSLRDEILELTDRSDSADGERKWSATKRLQDRLWSKEYAVYDEYGVYLGQGIRFSLRPDGVLNLRCAERLWRVTATVQGDLIDQDAPSLPLILRKENSFYSQWCEGRDDGTDMQGGAMMSAAALFPPDERGENQSASMDWMSALMQPYFNVRRSDFYRDSYSEGASDELAGRGVYGTYVLLFPYHGLLDGSFPLDRVEDVLLRFDLLSVDDI